MNYDYLDSLKQMPSSEIQDINKVLKDNCLSHKYDLIVIDHGEFIYAYTVKDADTIEKIRPLVGLEIEDSGTFTAIYDADGNYITDIDADLEDIENFEEELHNGDYDEYDPVGYLYYWLKNNKGYSSNRIYKFTTRY